MKISSKSVSSTARRQPLAAAIAALFALAAPETFATTWNVTTCADSGSGSLRDIVTNSAVSGDTVDFSQLNASNCPSSTISLTTGAITIPQNSLILQGRAQTITGYYNGAYENDRVLNHTGTGTLDVKNLSIEYNHFYPNGPVKGGCIYSAGNVILDHSLVFKCKAQPLRPGINSAANAQGGGLFVKGALIAKYSLISGNTASTYGNATGGGAYTVGGFNASNSTIASNYSTGQAGAVFSRHGASITSSTVSNNVAANAAAQLGVGGLFVVGSSTDSLQITNSTISGNSAPKSIVGGIASEVPTTVQNSTIAFNTAKSGTTPKSGGGFYYFAAGLFMNTGLSSSSPLNLQSSILSNNSYGTTESDFSALASAPYTITITSNNNLIRASSGPQRPATVTTACPLLGPLRSNGGPTQTHALMSHSPAIDTGNNIANLNEDQRGGIFDTTPYPYPRVSGPTADIGAYEVQKADIIFNTGFEGCPVLF